MVNFWCTHRRNSGSFTILYKRLFWIVLLLLKVLIEHRGSLSNNFVTFERRGVIDGWYRGFLFYWHGFGTLSHTRCITLQIVLNVAGSVYIFFLISFQRILGKKCIWFQHNFLVDWPSFAKRRLVSRLANLFFSQNSADLLNIASSKSILLYLKMYVACLLFVSLNKINLSWLYATDFTQIWSLRT